MRSCIIELWEKHYEPVELNCLSEVMFEKHDHETEIIRSISRYCLQQDRIMKNLRDELWWGFFDHHIRIRRDFLEEVYL